MPLKLGTGDVSFRLGSSTPAAAYLGSEQVWSAATVPGAPTITQAFDTGGEVNVDYVAPASDGGSAITGYVYYVNGSEVTPTAESAGFATIPGASGDTVEVSAVNAVGEGPKSDPETVA